MNLHLRTKLLFIVIAVSSIALFAFGKIAIEDSRTQIANLLDTQALYQAKTLAEGSLDGLVSEDYELLEGWVKSSLPSDAFAYAFLSRPDGTILTHTDGTKIGSRIEPIKNIKNIQSKFSHLNGRVIKEVIYPARLGNRIIANSHIGYYQDTKYKLLRQTTIKIVIVALVIIAFIVIGIGVATRTITKPIEKLTSLFGQVNLERKIFIDRSISNRHDEIGVLATSFQNMSETLVSSHSDLMESLSVNKMIVDSAMDGIILFDLGGHIISANNAAEDMFQYNKGELIGKDIGNVLPEVRKTLKETILDGVPKEELSYLFDHRHTMLAVTKSEEKVPVQIYLNIIEKDMVCKYACVIHDFSERIKYENALVSEKEKAEAGNKAKSDFLSVISHEIRTPINGILGSLDLIREETSKDKIKEYYEGAYISAKRMAELVEDILQFTIVSDKNTQIQENIVDLSSLNATITNEFEDYIAGSNINFHYECSPQVPSQFIGAFKYIKRVLVILIRNAFKFTTEGYITLKISSANTHSEDEHIIVYEVIDTGIGISEKEQGRIFDLFTQADSSYSRGHMGVGLGLTLCRELLRLMNGTISVESKPGTGSRFIVRIPYQVVDNENSPHHGIVIFDKKHYLPKMIENILVAEDDKVNQVLIHSYLKKLGYSATIVENGQEAIDEIEAHHYDLILMDCQMPIMDGYRATSIIRDDLHLQIPIIAVTANVAKEDKDKCFEVGMDDYISKPFKISDLQETIQKYAC